MTVDPSIADRTITDPGDASGEDPSPGRIVDVLYVDPHTLVLEENVRSDSGDDSDLDPDFVSSIAEHGVRQPIVVRRRLSDDVLVVRNGKQRTRAARLAGRWVDVVIEREPAPETDLDRDEQIARIVAQLEENQHRAATSDADEVRAHGQLLLMWGMSAEEIAEATHSKPDRVRRTTSIAASAAAMGILDQLDLSHLAVVAEFDDDDAAVAELVLVAQNNPGQFDHLAQRLRQDREVSTAYAAKAEQLAASGKKVVDPSDYEEASELFRLRARPEDPPHSTALTVEEHIDCPGHAVSIDVYRRGDGGLDADELDWCLDPSAHGHVPLWAPSIGPASAQRDDANQRDDATTPDGSPAPGGVDLDHLDHDPDQQHDPSSDTADHGVADHETADLDAEQRAELEQTQRDRAEREKAEHDRLEQQRVERERARRRAEQLERYEAQVTRNRCEAARAAETVRRTWLSGFVNRKSTPKEAARYSAEILVQGSIDFEHAAATGHDLACELLGMAAPQFLDDDAQAPISQDLLTAVRSASAGRATVLVLALLLAGQEYQVSHWSWRDHEPDTARYLARLQGWGYTLSPIEQMIIDPDSGVVIDGDPVAPPPEDPITDEPTTASDPIVEPAEPTDTTIEREGPDGDDPDGDDPDGDDPDGADPGGETEASPPPKNA